MLAPKVKAPNARAAVRSSGEMTLLLRDLRAGLSQLPLSDRRQARSYLARPTDPGGDQLCDPLNPCPVVLDGTVATKSTSHFLIHYQTSPPPLGADQTTTQAQVEKTAAVLEHAYYYETSHLGFRKPLSDVGTSSPSDSGTEATAPTRAVTSRTAGSPRHRNRVMP